MKEAMLIGRNFHYYVREGELSADFERAFERALDKAVETIAKTMGIENQDHDLNPYTVLEDQGESGATNAAEDFENGPIETLRCSTKPGKEPSVEDLT